jgi:hypothetical protein
MSVQPLKGFTSVFDATLNNEIQDGIIEYFDWALLEKGNYFNVTKGELGPSGEDMSRLRLSEDERFAAGRAWDSFRKNWVWQSGVSYNPPPIVGTNNTKPGISGVYINDVFYPSTTTGQYAHYVDYYNGRVIFNSPIPTGSKVQVEHSYKWINVVYPDSVPWLQEIQTGTLEPTPTFFQKNKGTYNLPPEARLQLPAIVVEIVPTRNFKGYQLGGGQWVYTDVIFHCLAEDAHTRNKLVDIVSLQNDKNIRLFDTNGINTSGDFPLDYRGTPVSGALRYPDLVEKHDGGLLRLTSTSVSEMVNFSTNIFGGIVRVKTEGIKLNI